MQFSTLALTGLLAAAASAYEVLTPTLNSTITKGSTINIKWTSVVEDASVFSIYITNFATAHWPPTVLSLAQNVPREDGSIDLRVPGSLSSDYGWTINFVNGTNTYVIYAQSPVFELVGPDVADPVVVAPAPYPTYAAGGYSNATTVHGTVTVHATATATATLCKTVATVVYATPIVWFVEPSKEAVCYNPAKETVTVTATVTEGGHSAYPTGGEGGKPTGYPSGGEGAYPTGGEGAYPTGGEGGKPTAGEGYPTGGEGGNTPYPTGPGAIEVPAPSGTGGYVVPTKGPEFTGAASSVRVGGVAAMIVGVAAFLL